MLCYLKYVLFVIEIFYLFFQVSVLSPPGSAKPSCHWFTATPDPSISVYKPFVFTPHVQISHLTLSPIPDLDPAKVIVIFLYCIICSPLIVQVHAHVCKAS